MFTDSMQALYIILYIAPYSVLRYYPFLQHLRISVRQLCSIYGLLMSIEILLFVILSKQEFWNVGWTQVLRLSFTAIFAILSFIVIKTHFFKNFFIYLLMIAYSGLINGTAHMLEASVNHYYGPVPKYTIINLAMAVQLAVTMPFAFRLIKRKLIPLLEVKETDVWNYIWLIPTMLIIFALLFGIDLSAETVMNWKFYAARSLLIAGSVFSSFIVMKVVEQARQTAALTENIRMTDKLLEVQSNYYKMLADNINRSKAARHDMHHHLLVMQAYLSNQQTEELAEYVQQYQQHLDACTPHMLCNHPIASAILAHYQTLAAEEQIEFSAKVDMPEKWGIADLDLCTILGNMLENALEACNRTTEENKQIVLHVKHMGNMVILTVDNSYNGELRIAPSSSLYSSKRVGEAEGFGLHNIRNAVEKYQGVLEITYTDTLFQTSVMLNQRVTAK